MGYVAELPNEGRFYYDLAQERRDHIARCEAALGKVATSRSEWLMTDWSVKPVDFRGAVQAQSGIFYFDTVSLELAFDLNPQNADGTRHPLPQDEETMDEILTNMVEPGRFYSSMTKEEARDNEFEPARYIVVAQPEGRPFIVNFFIWDTLNQKAAASKNASFLSGEECAEMLGFVNQFTIDLKDFDREFGCE